MLITGLYAGILALLFIALCVNVIRKRLAFKIGIGDGGNHELSKAIRIHANFAEHVPFAIVLIALCDYAQYNPYLIHAMGLTLLMGRVLHSYGLSKTSVRSSGRTFGVLMTYAVIIIAALLLIIQGAQAYI